MQKLGFVQSFYDSALYLNNNGTYVAVYVDDLHIVGPDLPLIVELKNQLAAKFKTTDLGPTAHYLGVEVLHKGNTITVTQTVYIDQLAPCRTSDVKLQSCIYTYGRRLMSSTSW